MADTLLNGNLRKSETLVRAPPTQDRNILRQETLLRGNLRVCLLRRKRTPETLFERETEQNRNTFSREPSWSEQHNRTNENQAQT